MQVLLIDDDVELGVLLEKFLKKEGYHLDREYEGTRGLRRALEGAHDLVVLDVMLPGLDGFEILRQIRRESQIPILMLTARGEDVDRIVGLELGAAAEDLDRIFDPFYRVNGDRDRSSGGVGLGLSIARRAVELHHGDLRARNSSPGLTVEMRLPGLLSDAATAA